MLAWQSTAVHYSGWLPGCLMHHFVCHSLLPRLHCRTASRDSKLYKEAADQLAAAGLLEDATRPVPIGGLLRGLLDMAAEAPVKARDTAVWLLGKLG